MTTPAFRLPALAAAALLLPLAAPASAAMSDSAMLQSYAGSYAGEGTITASPPQQVRCNLLMQPAGAARLDYSGRCSAGGVSFSMSGVITAAKGRFRAVMSGNGGGAAGAVSDTVNGTRRGDGVVFKSTRRDTGSGHDRTIASSLALSGGTLRIDFNVLDNQTGKTIVGVIPFSRVGR